MPTIAAVALASDPIQAVGLAATELGASDSAVPERAILDEAGDAILDEAGQYILDEAG